jgi:transcriptional regulator with XRE-family HTH domain
MSGRELARRLGESHTWVARRLAAEQEITVDDLARIASVLNVTPVSMLGAVA